MRDATSTQAEWAVALERSEHVRVRISDHEGTLVDRTSWVQTVRISEDVDSFAIGADVNLHREKNGQSIAPLMTDPKAINGGRRILVDVAFLDLDETPDEGDWTELFDGRLDDPQWGGRENRVTLPCRSRIAALLHDRWVEEVTTYSGTQAGVMQQLMDDVLGDDAPTLVVLGDPDTFIPEYTQRRQSLQDALQALADVNGWVVRERWNESAGAFRLTLYEPDRDKDTADATFGPSDFFEISDIRLQSLGVRTVVIIQWEEGLFGFAEDSAAIAMEGVGRKVLYIDAQDDPFITSQAQAQALAELILRDVSTALVGQVTPHGLYWRVQLEDLYTYEPDDTWASESRTMAVVGYEHVLSTDPETPSVTMISGRGQPSGGADRWYVKDRRTRRKDEIIPPTVPPTPPPDFAGVELYLTTTGGTQGFSEESTPEASLGKYISTTELPTGLWGEISEEDRIAGTTLYRTIALAVTDTLYEAYALKAWISEQGVGGLTLSFALDAEGVVDLEREAAQGGESADGETAPSPAVTFVAPEAFASGETIGDVLSRETILVHQRLVVAADSEQGEGEPRMCFALCLPDEAA